MLGEHGGKQWLVCLGIREGHLYSCQYLSGRPFSKRAKFVTGSVVQKPAGAKQMTEMLCLDLNEMNVVHE